MKNISGKTRALIISGAAAILVIAVCAAVLLLRSTPQGAIEGHIRAMKEYDADALFKYTSDYELRKLMNADADADLNTIRDGIRELCRLDGQMRETGRMTFSSEVLASSERGSDLYDALLSEYAKKADTADVNGFSVVTTKLYIDGDLKDTYTAAAVLCGAEWRYAFEYSKEDLENKMSMQIEKKDDGTEIVHVTLPKQKLSDNAANLPFDNRFTQTEFSAELSSKRDLTPRAVIEYRKRAEGTYVYSNNPEMLAKPDVGQALLRNKGLTGEVFFTYEHSNHTGAPIFLGYQLLNEGDTPVTVRVENIGNQVRGEWLGQREWTDFFGVKFDLPADYWNEDGQTVNPIYVGGDYVDYAPQGYVPEEFTVPAGGYVWVLGGTSGDRAYGALSGKTADQAIMTGKCANGAVRFIVSGGSVTGTFWCYTEPSQCDPAKPQQGYIIDRDGKHYAAQYKGIDTETNGLAEAEVSWIFNDMTRSGKLPVTYQVRRDPNYASITTPYTPFNLQETTVRGNTWLTSLNPNNNPTAVGTDMINFSCVTTDGKEVRIDTESTDGAGKTANIGNWMMENQTNFTFINAGTRERTLRIYTRNTGVLAVMIRNEGGELLEQKLIMQPYSFDSLDQVFAGVDKSLLVEKNGRWWFRVADGRPYCDVWNERSLVYELTVPAGDYCRISVDDLILANSCGGVLRWVEID